MFYAQKPKEKNDTNCSDAQSIVTVATSSY